MIHNLWCYSIYICTYHIQRVGCVEDDPLPECQVSSCRAFKKDVLLIYWACKIVWCTRLGLTPPWTTYPPTSIIQGISTRGRKTTKAHSWSTRPAYIIRPYNTPQLLTLPPTSQLTTGQHGGYIYCSGQGGSIALLPFELTLKTSPYATLKLKVELHLSSQLHVYQMYIRRACFALKSATIYFCMRM